MDKVFFGESIFSLLRNTSTITRNTSTITFVYFVKNIEYELMDCQVKNPYLKSLNKLNIQHDVFIQRIT